MLAPHLNKPDSQDCFELSMVEIDLFSGEEDLYILSM